MALHPKVKDIIVEQLGVDPEKVKPEASFIDDLGADSLDIVELVMAMEEEFDLEIPDEDGRTPLFNAAYNGNKKIVRLLLSAGANTNIVDNEGLVLTDLLNKLFK